MSKTKLMKRFLFILLLLSKLVQSQTPAYFYNTKHLFDIGIGISSNIAVYELGVTTKLHIPLTSHFSIQGELTYFPGTYHINELYSNLNLQFTFLQYRSFSSYALGGYSYNQWYNNPEGKVPITKTSGANLGIGSQYSFHNTALFAELLSNSIYMETSLCIGIKQSFYKTFKKTIIKTKDVRFL